MYLGGIDIYYLILILPAALLSLLASAMLKSLYAKYDKVMASRVVSGAQAAQILLKANGITDVRIVHIGGKLTDNYNPSTKTLSLSDSTFASRSVAAVGVAAHETGHAIQHNVGYGPLIFRRMLVPVANFGSRFGPMLAIIGIILGAVASLEQYIPIFQLITDVGILLFGASMIFYIVTLPVEFNASRRALRILKETNTLVSKDEIKGARKVLTAAALTYVASALTAIGSFLRLLLIANSRRNRR